MAYVSVPKDLTKVKKIVLFILTKRQIICIGIAAAIGLPFYFLTREALGTSNAATGMVLLMLPAILFALFEKDGMPLERILFNIIRVKVLNPGIRPYETENLYSVLTESESANVQSKSTYRKKTKQKPVASRNRRSVIDKKQ